MLEAATIHMSYEEQRAKEFRAGVNHLLDQHGWARRLCQRMPRRAEGQSITPLRTHGRFARVAYTQRNSTRVDGDEVLVPHFELDKWGGNAHRVGMDLASIENTALESIIQTAWLAGEFDGSPSPASPPDDTVIMVVSMNTWRKLSPIVGAPRNPLLLCNKCLPDRLALCITPMAVVIEVPDGGVSIMEEEVQGQDGYTCWEEVGLVLRPAFVHVVRG